MRNASWRLIGSLILSILLVATPSACGGGSSGGGGGGGGGGSPQGAIAIQLSPAALDFGTVAVGRQAQRTLAVTSTGTSPAHLSSITASGGYQEADGCASALAPGSSCTITITFAPGAAGPSAGLITVRSDVPGGPATAPITGAGVYDGVLTQHHDNTRSGLYPETTLTTANVSPATFGKLATFPVDGLLYAQPLLARSVNVPGRGVHDVVYVATEHDSLYAFDASGLSPTPLWSVSFIAPPDVVPIPSDDLGCPDLVPEIGITGTPVVDGTTGTLYLVVRTKEAATTANPVRVERLHALDLATGAERPGSPVTIEATVQGTGDGGSQVVFDPLTQNQRAALLLSRGTVYVAFAAHCDIPPYHGWMLGYDAATLAQTVVYNDTPDGSAGGIWQSGAGPAADDAGIVYAISGNGTFDPNDPRLELGESFLKLSPAGVLLDYFTPFNQAALSAVDLDLGSAGPLLLPDQPGSHPHLVVSAGKEGTIYLIDRDAMGHFQPSGDGQIVQELVRVLPTENDSAPTYWNGNVYFGAQGDAIQAFRLSGGLLSTSSVSRTADSFPFKGGFPVVSSDGGAGGILWALAVPDGQPSVLRAYDAAQLGSSIWSSDESGTRDALGAATKFSAPMVVGGRVYVATGASLSVFGLLQ